MFLNFFVYFDILGVLKSKLDYTILKPELSYNFYFLLLEEIKKKYSIKPLEDFSKNTKDSIVFLRHDVDISLEAALEMAELEAQHNISSTYMFIPDSLLYDIRSNKGKKILRKIQNLNHEIALHFDIETSGVIDVTDEREVGNLIKRDANGISEIVGQEVKSISFHRPIKQFLYGEDYLHGLVNAYSKTLMEFYRSDSRGSWKSENPMIDFSVNNFKFGQLLVHPIWWSNKPNTPEKSLELFFHNAVKSFTQSSIEKFANDLEITCPGVNCPSRANS